MGDDDSLGDLADVMGSDYNHGGDFEAGDPNIKPRQPAGPTRNQKKKVKHGVIHLSFQDQKQWLTKLEIQCLPCKFITEDKKANPFAVFTSQNGFIVQPKDPGTAKSAKFDKLPDGGQYISDWLLQIRLEQFMVNIVHPCSPYQKCHQHQNSVTQVPNL